MLLVQASKPAQLPSRGGPCVKWWNGGARPSSRRAVKINPINHARPSSTSPATIPARLASPPLPSPPLLLSKITCDRDAARSPSPLRSRPPPNPIGPVAAPLHRTAEARREPRNQADRPSQSIRRVKWARGGRHGDHARRRRIGVEGGRRGRRPGRGLELGRHPPAHLLRLPLPLLRVGPPAFAHVPLRSS